jgi:hypothetical protein
VGTRQPDGYGVGQIFKHVMGIRFLIVVDIFHGYRLGMVDLYPLPSLHPRFHLIG